MRRGIAIIAVVSACGLLKKKEDAGVQVSTSATADDTASTAPTSSAAPIEDLAGKAVNAGKIARFGDETRIDNEPASVQQVSTVRETAGGGAIVASLPKGASVTKLAEHNKHFLVTFANPKNKAETLLGWIPDTAFTAASVNKGPCKTDKDCPPNLTCVAMGDVPPFCEDMRAELGSGCTADGDCRTGLKCRTFPVRAPATGVNKECAKSCKGDVDCGGSGFHCGPASDALGGTVCSKYVGKNPEAAKCAETGDCLLPLECLGGECHAHCDVAKPACAPGFGCVRADPRYAAPGKCVKGATTTTDAGTSGPKKLGDVCATNVECNPNFCCTLLDGGGGKRCVRSTLEGVVGSCR